MRDFPNVIEQVDGEIKFKVVMPVDLMASLGTLIMNSFGLSTDAVLEQKDNDKNIRIAFTFNRGELAFEQPLAREDYALFVYFLILPKMSETEE